ncbi:MAG: hypothetical protein JRG80_05050 [Deltaproteobacteria bacterium]|nr:hypothetical protein [Deltaproteobacteria bacterium]MBW2398624.1 hypothetical protein [Deltaproteobacteria bacterium]
MSDFFAGLNPLVLCIPFISGFIGWFTNWIAVKAMLYPVEFVGIPPLIGWQGVVPKNAEELSRNFSELIHDKLIDLEQIFADISHEDNEAIKRVVDDISEEILHEFATNLAPDKWARAREKLRSYISDLVHRNVRSVTKEILERMSREASDFIDIDSIVREAMVEDRALLGRVMMEIAGPEFKFIERSGLWFGGLFGVIQMFIWIAYPISWVLPAAGFFVGYATNWLAMTLIFEPREPVQIGPLRVQGVFIKRQLEVARNFADVIADRVLNSDNLIRHLAEGPSREPVMKIVEEQVEASMRVYERDTMVAMLVSKEKIAEAKEDMLDRVRNADMSQSGPVQAFADQSDRIHAQIEKNLQELDSSEFSVVLRPVFQKDEWKLVLAGGVIGTLIGALQVVFLFGGF